MSKPSAKLQAPSVFCHLVSVFCYADRRLPAPAGSQSRPGAHIRLTFRFEGLWYVK